MPQVGGSEELCGQLRSAGPSGEARLGPPEGISGRSRLPLRRRRLKLRRRLLPRGLEGSFG
jgi:hypothetical protein